MYQVNYQSPLGPLVIKASSKGIQSLSQGICDENLWNHHLNDAVEQLDLYFAEELKKFSLSLDLAGTPFQLNTWHELIQTKYGQTLSYLELALRVSDNKNYTRAVAGANNKNKIPIIIPCHRVIGSDGSLTGFAWGLSAKKFLLDLEGAKPRA